MINITYDISGEYDDIFDISVYYSDDNGKTFKGPLKSLEGDFGSGLRKGRDKKIVWDVYSEVMSLGGNLIFDIRANVTKETLKRDISVSTSSTGLSPVGLRFEVSKKYGFYISARTALSFKTDGDYTFENNKLQNAPTNSVYSFNDVNDISRMILTFGMSRKLNKNLAIYGGLGYGTYNQIWGIDTKSVGTGNKLGEYSVKNEDKSFSGAEFEFGLTYRINKFVLSAGVTTLQFERNEFTGGIGYIIN